MVYSFQRPLYGPIGKRKGDVPMKCSVCGCENEAAVTVCSQCGTALTLPAAETLCCHCGKQIRPTAKYCVYCGGSQAQPPAEAEEAAEVAPAEACVPAETLVAQEVAAEAPAAEDAAPAAEPAPAPVIIVAPAAPAYKLPVSRSLAKMFFLGIITCMLYPLVIMSRLSMEINMVASRHDGKRTMHFLWMPVIGVLTLGVYFFVWIHQLCGRIGNELHRRQISYKFGAGSFWLWNLLWGILGAIVTCAAVLVLAQTRELQAVAYLVGVVGGIVSSIGPFVFIRKLMRATNLMNADYNEKG